MPPQVRRPVSTWLVRGLWVKVKVSRGASGLGEGLCKVPRRVYLESAGCWSVVSKEGGLFPLGAQGERFPDAVEMEGQERERKCGQLAGGGWGLSRAVTSEPGEGLGRPLGRSGRDPAGPPGPAPQ